MNHFLKWMQLNLSSFIQRIRSFTFFFFTKFSQKCEPIHQIWSELAKKYSN